MEVEWRNLSVTIGQKRILAPCSGSIRPGRMVALMGPSGSGKTTLLTCLRQDIPHEGEVRFDGARFAPELRQLIGFVEQDDVIIPPLTVRQTLMFLAELRFGIGSPAASSKVEAVISLMRLDKVADSVVGEAGAPQRISGGERKRLCIARELLSEPKLIMCDEPTSGLDSTMAEQVVTSMRTLCDGGGVSVLAAIHQPSTSIFGRFDDLILLREGEVLYYGPTEDAEAFFTSHAVPRLPSQSTAEYLMDLLVIDTSKEDEVTFAGTGTQKHHVGMSQDMRLSAASVMREQAGKMPALEPLVKSKLGRRYAAPFGRQLMLLTRRHALLMVEATFTWLSCVQYLSLMLVSAVLWWRLGFSEQDVFPRLGVCLWTVGTWMFFPLFGGLGTFPSVRRIVEKELRIGCYSLEAFYLARTVMLLPFEFVFPLVWTTGMFWMTNANPDFGAYLLVLLSVMLSFTLFQGVGLALSASDMPPERSGTVSIIMITYFFAWTGFFMDNARLPEFVSWGATVNPFAYSFELMVNLILPDSAEYDCDATFARGTPSGELEGCVESEPGKFTLSGQAARERYGIKTEPWVCILIMLIAMVVVRVVAFLLLRLSFRTAIDGAKGRHAPLVTAEAGQNQIEQTDKPKVDAADLEAEI